MQIQEAANKVAAGVSALSRLIANIGDPTPSRRCLLMSSTQSVLLYGAEIWANALGKRKRLAKAQRRGALRVASAYRIVSAPDVIVIAGVIPVALLAKERQAIYMRKGDEPPNEESVDRKKRE